MTFSATSKIRTMPSLPANASDWPSGANASARIGDLAAGSSPAGWPSGRCQSLTNPPSQLVASVAESGLMAVPKIARLCPFQE